MGFTQIEATQIEALIVLLTLTILSGLLRYGYYTSLDITRQPAWVLRPKKFGITKQVIFWPVYYVISVIFAMFIVLVSKRMRPMALHILKDHFFIFVGIGTVGMVVSAAWSLSANIFEISALRIIFFYVFIILGYWLVEKLDKI